MGYVAKIGPGVTGFAVGDRVAAGGFATLRNVAVDRAYKLPESELADQFWDCRTGLLRGDRAGSLSLAPGRQSGAHRLRVLMGLMLLPRVVAFLCLRGGGARHRQDQGLTWLWSWARPKSTTWPTKMSHNWPQLKARRL